MGCGGVRGALLLAFLEIPARDRDTVEIQVGRRAYPVLQDNEVRPARCTHLHVHVVMPEDEIVHRSGLLVFGGELVQRLVLAPEEILRMPCKAVAPGPAVADAESYPRMEHAEKELKHPVVENSTEQTVACRHRTESVAVPEAEMRAIDIDIRRLDQPLHPELLEIMIGPYIVVALEKIDIHA